METVFSCVSGDTIFFERDPNNIVGTITIEFSYYFHKLLLFIIFLLFMSANHAIAVFDEPEINGGNKIGHVKDAQAKIISQLLDNWIFDSLDISGICVVQNSGRSYMISKFGFNAIFTAVFKNELEMQYFEENMLPMSPRM